jgi:hypothetical protein
MAYQIKRPIKILIGTAMIVEIKPVTAAAIPAMCPTAPIARKLPKETYTEKLHCKKQQNTEHLDLAYYKKKNKDY